MTMPGPIADEAAKLFEALSQLPLGTGSAECSVCPLCQLLSVLRRTNPETFAHLAEASTALVAALRTIVDSHGSTAAPSTVQRIDLDET